MEDIINADYRVIQERTLPIIISEIKTIEAQVYKTAIDGAAEIGARLLEAKEQVGHGNWIQWCEENLNYTTRQAQNFIKIHEHYGDENSPYANAKTSSYLSISKALALLQVPEDEVEKFEKEHENGEIENMTVKALKDEIEQWKKKHEELESEQEAFVQQISEAEIRRTELTREIAGLKANAADPAQIQTLEKELEKQKKKVEKVKADLEKEKKSKLETVQSAVEEQKQKIKEEAEAAQAEKLKDAQQARQELEEQLAKTEKKLELSNNEDVTRIKLHLDTIQKSFMTVDVALDNVALADKQQAEKLRDATKKILQNLIGKLEG